MEYIRRRFHNKLQHWKSHNRVISCDENNGDVTDKLLRLIDILMLRWTRRQDLASKTPLFSE